MIRYCRVKNFAVVTFLVIQVILDVWRAMSVRYFYCIIQIIISYLWLILIKNIIITVTDGERFILRISKLKIC